MFLIVHHVLGYAELRELESVNQYGSMSAAAHVRLRVVISKERISSWPNNVWANPPDIPRAAWSAAQDARESGDDFMATRPYHGVLCGSA